MVVLGSYFLDAGGNGYVCHDYERSDWSRWQRRRNAGRGAITRRTDSKKSRTKVFCFSRLCFSSKFPYWMRRLPVVEPSPRRHLCLMRIISGSKRKLNLAGGLGEIDYGKAHWKSRGCHR